MVMMAYVGPAGVKFSNCGWLSLMSPSHPEPPARSSWVEYHVNCSCSTPFYLQTGRMASLFLGLKWLPVSSSFPYLTKSVSTLSPAGGFPGLSAYHALLICSYRERGYSFPWEDVLAALLSWRLKCVRHQVFYSFPYCCFSKSPQRGGSEEQKCVLLYLWSPKCGPSLTGLSRGVGVALSLGRGVCFPASSNFWWLRAFLLCGHSAPILHPSSHDHLISSLVCSQIALGLPIL